MHGFVPLVRCQRQKLVGVIDLFLERFPACDGPPYSIEPFNDNLGFLVVGPECRFLAFLIELFGLIAKLVNFKDTPEASPGAISNLLYRL
jgi:hypothetical protein